MSVVDFNFTIGICMGMIIPWAIFALVMGIGQQGHERTIIISVVITAVISVVAGFMASSIYRGFIVLNFP